MGVGRYTQRPQGMRCGEGVPSILDRGLGRAIAPLQNILFFCENDMIWCMFQCLQKFYMGYILTWGTFSLAPLLYGYASDGQRQTV